MKEYWFQFKPAMPLVDVESVLILAMMAADCFYEVDCIDERVERILDHEQHAVRVRGDDEAVDRVVRLFTALSCHEFGHRFFEQRHVSQWPVKGPNRESVPAEGAPS